MHAILKSQKGFGHIELVLAVLFIGLFAFVGVRIVNRSSAAVPPPTGGGSAPTIRPVPKDIPVPADYNGDGKADIAVWNNSTGVWKVNTTLTTITSITTTYGTVGDIPVPADYNGDKKAEFAVFRPSNGTWYVKGATAVTWGTNGDIPVPADYNGDGKADLAVFRPSDGKWYVKGVGTMTNFVSFATQPNTTNTPVAIPEMNAGDGVSPLLFTQYANTSPANYTYIPSFKLLHSFGYGNYGGNFGATGDIAQPFKLVNQHGYKEGAFAAFRPSNGTWYVKIFSVAGTYKTVAYGTAGDIPVAADYNGDGIYEYAVWRHSNATWYLRSVKNIVFGTAY